MSLPIAELERLATELAVASRAMTAQLDRSIARLDATLDPAREAALKERLEAEAHTLSDTVIAGTRELFGL